MSPNHAAVSCRRLLRSCRGGLTVAFLLLLLIPAGALRAELPKPGTDLLNVAVTLEIQVNPGPTQIVRLFGQMAIQRGIGDPNQIPIEIVSLNLSGLHPVLGRVEATIDPHFRSAGVVRMLPPTETPADSFFDVWFDITLPDMGRSFYQGDWYNIESRTTAIPFFDVFSETFSQSVPLIDQLTGLPAGSLSHVSLNPHPRIDILMTQAQVDWSLGTLHEIFPMSGKSLVVASESFGLPGPGQSSSFNTEIVAMDLTGTSPSRGPLLFTEQMQVHSPGQSVAANPGPAQFPSDSFFDVFFDLHNASFDVFCADPTTGKAMVDTWPPLGVPYLPPGPCTLFNRSTGVQVGRLNGFQWVWTQPAGGCVDADGDGVFAPPCGTDCDDTDPNNFPGNLEACKDGRDNNCNGLIDCRDPICTGRACDDGDPCTRPDTCFTTGLCSGPQVDCNDNNLCTLDHCSPTSGLCLHVPVNCDDQNPCTVDSCAPTSGQCVHAVILCDDNNPCTQDACDPTTGQCKFTPTPGATCDDGNLCTQGDRCVASTPGGVICQGQPIICDDSNPCTQDFCEAATGQCRHAPMVGQVCDDGNDCTRDDVCVQVAGGVLCQGTPVDCNDQDPCTQDSCEPSGCLVPDNGTGTATLPPQGCGYTSENDLQILDGLPAGTSILIQAVQKGFVCPGGPSICSFPPPIPGGDCDQAGGTLGGEQECAGAFLEMHMTGTGALAGFNRIIALPVGVEENAAPRTPGDPVQSFDALVFRMQGQLLPGDPDFDLLRITAGSDFGLPSPGHTILSQQGSSWAVDSFFDITYRIDFVGHVTGPLSGMSGSTTGTSRFKTRPGGCVHRPVDCDDQNPCTLDRCNPVNGQCEHAPVDCDDHNQCTKDSCDPTSGLCRHEPDPGAPCDDGNACTQNDKCVQGPLGNIGCQGSPISCDDQNPCTFDSCNPQNGLCVHIPNSCDDNNVCTSDSCNPITGVCEHRPIPVLEPNPLLFRDQVTLYWPATSDATHWNTYRGTIPMKMLGSRLPASVYDQACFESDDAGANGPTTAIDLADPARGTAFYYLTSGENGCGESEIGHPFPPPGATIPNSSPCPTPP